jgi:3-deoxy-D-arabino-heptulosonate 7-phosphate (DAHP) synthase class II
MVACIDDDVFRTVDSTQPRGADLEYEHALTRIDSDRAAVRVSGHLLWSKNALASCMVHTSSYFACPQPSEEAGPEPRRQRADLADRLDPDHEPGRTTITRMGAGKCAMCCRTSSPVTASGRQVAGV